MHQDQPLQMAGAALEDATAAVVMLHGRGATAGSILTLAEELDAPEDLAFVAPQATGRTWYPHSFLAPLDANEPWLSAALVAVRNVVERMSEAGIPHERIVLLGFSQGACLATEFAARHAQRYGGVVAFSGGLIGPEGTARDYAGSLEGTPVFLGCSDVDPHIPLERVHETDEVLTRIGGTVTKRIYPGMGHTINQDELTHVRSMLRTWSKA